MQYGTNEIKLQARNALRQKKQEEEEEEEEEEEDDGKKNSVPRHCIVHDSFLPPQSSALH